MINNLSDYELLKKQQRLIKISPTNIIIAMVLMTAVGCSVFALLRAVFPPPDNRELPVGFGFNFEEENDKALLRFLSQTYDPVNNRYIVSLSLKVPADLINNDDFKYKACEELRNEIEDGFDRKFAGTKTVLADLVKHQIERSGISIGIYYYLKLTQGRVESDGDLVTGVYAGWDHYAIEFFELVHKTRMERIEPKFEITKEEELVAASNGENKNVKQAAEVEVDVEKNEVLTEIYDA